MPMPILDAPPPSATSPACACPPMRRAARRPPTSWSTCSPPSRSTRWRAPATWSRPTSRSAAGDDFLQPGRQPEHAGVFTSSERYVDFMPLIDTMSRLEQAVGGARAAGHGAGARPGPARAQIDAQSRRRSTERAPAAALRTARRRPGGGSSAEPPATRAACPGEGRPGGDRGHGVDPDLLRETCGGSTARYLGRPVADSTSACSTAVVSSGAVSATCQRPGAVAASWAATRPSRARARGSPAASTAVGAGSRASAGSPPGTRCCSASSAIALAG